MQPRSAQRIALAYVALASTWIILSTLAGVGFNLTAFVTVYYELFKGLLFVFVTGSLLFAYIRREIRRAENQLEITRAIIHSSPAILFVWGDEDGWPVHYVSENVDRLGYKPEDFLENKRDFASIIHPTDLPKVERHWRKYMANERPAFNLDYRLLSKNGRVLWVAESTTPIYDKHGEIKELQGTIIDITDRRLQELGYELAAHLDRSVLNDLNLDEIFSSFCRRAAESLDLSLVWIGEKHSDGAIVNRAAEGPASDYARSATFRWDDTPEGNGPEGLAIRKGQAQYLSVHASETTPWREQMLRRNLQETFVIPLDTGREIVGFLAAYSQRSGGISALHRRLLRDVGRNVGVAWKNAERQNRLQRQDAALSNTIDGVVITDKDGHVEWVNRSFERLTGYRFAEIEGRNMRFLKSGRHDLEFYQKLWRNLLSGRTFTADFVNRRRDGSLYEARQTITPLTDNQGMISSYVGIQEDITAQKEAERRLEHLAGHDPLTDLANRNKFHQALAGIIERYGESGKRFAVLYLDIDRFKVVNDAMGHSTGDRLLQRVAHRIQQVLRHEDILARLGGDEFAILQHDISGSESAAHLARRIVHELHEPVQVDGHEFNATVSVGITTFPDDGTDAEELLRNADLAMYEAKHGGRNTYREFSAAMDDIAQSRATLESGLRGALRSNEFEVHYQPQMCLSDNTLVGLEALVRWRRSDGTLVPPGAFIAAAEDTGLIAEIGQVVLQKTCELGRQWLDQGICPERLSVNLSFAQFQNQDLVGNIRRTLTRLNFPPERLELELTESILATYPEEAVMITQRLHALGIQLAIDDFGTGYSSFRYLREFPVSRLKIDQSFVRDLDSPRPDDRIVKATINLGHDLGLKVIAEGVETMRQAEVLRELGCDEIQGYLLARPAPADQVEALMRRGNPLEQLETRER